MKNNNFYFLLSLFIAMFYLFYPDTAIAYVGPGAGFALLTSFFMLFIAFFLAFISVLSWPIRTLYRIIIGKNAYKKSSIQRTIIVGLDGLDPELTNKYMEEGKLHNFKKLKETGTFLTLQTTYPSISPVAWSSFMTGVNPGRHNIFDFLSRDKKTYLPVLSSTFIGSSSRSLKLGKYIIPLGKPVIKLLRKSQPFWNVLGKQGIFSTILRVPVTFPPEKVYGLILSGMCVPDIKGTQGTFAFYTTADSEQSEHTGGVRIQVNLEDGIIRTYISGPPNPITKSHEELYFPFTARVGKEEVEFSVGNQKFKMKRGQYSDWIKLSFKAGLGIKISGICRFYLKQINPDFELYITPVNIDPEKAALPISYPKTYASYLSKLQGSFATLGLAEDTWALNEGVIGEEAFLRQCYDIHKERENMFFNALDKMDKGLCVCVFDITDRIQHEFLRFLDSDHPANEEEDGNFNNVIEELYINMDKLVGQVMEKIDDKTVLIVMSDHGFKQFKRGINLNSWLHINGYLHLKKEGDGNKEWFADVDWNKTKAYAMGLAGIYLNRKGREVQGIVNAGEETESLKKELIKKLSGLKDEEKRTVAVNNVFDSLKVLSGPYIDNAPDLFVGYNDGYRASWDSVTGKVNEEVITDNTKSWGADHCIDPQLVPGIFFCNKKVSTERPRIIDIAPTVLKLFSIDIPGYMDGLPLIDL